MTFAPAFSAAIDHDLLRLLGGVGLVFHGHIAAAAFVALRVDDGLGADGADEVLEHFRVLRVVKLHLAARAQEHAAVIRADLPACEGLYNGLADIVPANLVAQDLEIVQNLRLAGVGRLGF